MRAVPPLMLSGRGTAGRIREAIDELNSEYDRSGRAFRIERLAGGWQILTRPDFGPLLARLHQQRQLSRLSQAALESLAIIAYRSADGGVIRAEIEAIRGVSCGDVLRGLLDRRLIKIVGRAEELGRPMLYGVTREFLKVFGLSSLDDLPQIEGLRDSNARLKKKAAEQDRAPQDDQEPKSPGESDEAAQEQD